MDHGFPASLRRAFFGARAHNIDKDNIVEDQKKNPVGRCKSLTSFPSTNSVNCRTTHLSAMARLEDFSSHSQYDDDNADNASVMFNDQDCVLLERVTMKNARFIFSEPEISPDAVESDSCEQSDLTSGSEDAAKTIEGSRDDDGNSWKTPFVDHFQVLIMVFQAFLAVKQMPPMLLTMMTIATACTLSAHRSIAFFIPSMEPASTYNSSICTKRLSMRNMMRLIPISLRALLNTCPPPAILTSTMSLPAIPTSR